MNKSRDEAYHLNREPHERALVAESTDPKMRAVHLRPARMHVTMAQDAKERNQPQPKDRS